MGRKSTAQPRPVLHVPPRGIGPIAEPNDNDVLCGRGGRINSHPGNVKFRDVINAKKKEYLAPTTKKLEKAHIAAAIVNDIRSMNPPGRFLKEDRDTGMWFDIGDAKAIKKTGQALREDAPEIRPELEEDSSGDEKQNATDEGKQPAKASESSPKEKKPEAKPKSPKKVEDVSTSKPSPKKLVNFVENVPQQSQGHPGPWQQGMMMGPPMAMPPPYSHQVNPYAGQPMPMQTFETRNIPIQQPAPQPYYTIPGRQLVGSAMSIGHKAASVSKHALDVLSRSAGVTGMERNPTPEEEAFGRTFHPPTTSVLSADHTMSTISGLSDPLSSSMGMDTGSGIMGARGSGVFGFSDNVSMRSARNSAHNRNLSIRMSQLGLGVPGMRARSSMGMSDLSFSMGSLKRSSSFPDMNSFVDHDSWRAIMELDEEGMVPPPDSSLLSGASSGRLSTGSGQFGFLPQQRSSAMSIASMSTSSSAWLAGLNNVASVPVDDGRSVLSEMSSDLHALDLAGHEFYRM